MRHPRASWTYARHSGGAAVAAALLAACAVGEEPGFQPGVGQSGEMIESANPVASEYIVVLDDDLAAAWSVQTLGAELLASYGPDAQMMQVFEYTISGFSARMSVDAARDLAANPAVRYVEENAHVELMAVQEEPVWNLDRVDQRVLPLDDAYAYGVEGRGVNVYVIDTGIRTTHVEFEGRAQEAFTNIDDGRGAQDCHGHGTHVAGTVGSETWGVAKEANLFAVRVFDCDGRGATTASVIEAVDWVTANAEGPAVANMSLGAPASEAFDEAVARSIDAGITYAAAAGNNGGGDACEHSPARVPTALTVGAAAHEDYLAHFTNIGDCVDLFAPGLGIDSTGAVDDTSRKRKSGTSMATPHVAGAAALYLEENPTATPAEVHDAVVTNATEDVLRGLGDDWPNRLLFTGFVGGGDGAPGGP